MTMGNEDKWSRCRRRWLQERPIGNTKGATRRYLQLSAAVERLTPSKPYPAMLGGREESSEAFTVPWPFWQMVALTVQNSCVKMEAPHSGPNQTRVCGMGEERKEGRPGWKFLSF